MAKLVFKKTTMVFTAAILVLMGACIGLLVALLKSQQQSGNPNSQDDLVSSSTGPTTAETESSSSPGQATTVGIPWNSEFRLSQKIVPLHYELELKPDLNNFNFSGRVVIRVRADEATKHFVVHKSKLDIERVEIRTVDKRTTLEVTDKSFYDKTELYVMELKEEAPVGEYELDFRFSGSLNGGNIVGFYSSSYTDPQGNKKYLATSKFQPTYARRAFPCFDEPSFKSTFTVTLEHQPEYKTILSNMPVEKSQPTKDGRMVTKFQKSVPMVTYLVCFIVCDFKSKSQEFESEGKNKTFKVFASPHQVEKTEFALEVGVHVINYYEEYFGIEYPLPKQDMIAIPDFSSGAMEHWGLITYRETNLLYDEKMSSTENRQRVAVVIAHELAHMWFGNLVTMEWWDNLWLNEGFASYMEYKGVNKMFPKWHMLDQFLTDDLQPVMLLDATNTSHPIIQQVKTNDQITEIFDTISYNKGAAVLRMLEFFVGEEQFRKGISNYLKKYKYKTAKTDELWAEMTSMTNGEHNIAEIMDTWTKQMGFPYINVTRNTTEDPTKFTVRQKRFLLNREMKVDDDASPFKYIWKIPLSYVTCTGEADIKWLNTANDFSFNIDNVAADCWVKFNRNQTGYYLVNYQKDEWMKIIDILKSNHTAFTPSDRANLLFDAFQLAESGVLEYEVPLEMTNYLVNEKDLTPWDTAYNSFVRLGHNLENTAEGYGLKEHIKKLTAHQYAELGWKKLRNQHTNSLLQSTIVGLACYSGNEDCIQVAVEKTNEWATNRVTDVPLNLKRIVLHYGMFNSGTNSQKTWEALWSMYLEEKSAQEKLTLLYGLAHTDQVKLIETLLQFASDTITNTIKSQDFFTVLNYIAGNPVGRPIVWAYVRNHWPQLVKRFSLNDRYLGRAVKNICDYFTTEEELQSMIDFFGSTEAGAGAMARNQSLQNVRNNIRWLKINKEAVGETFNMTWNNYRLSNSVVPNHYDLLLHPNLTTNEFQGRVTILVNVTEATKYFTLHAKHLDITKTEVRRNSTGEVIPSHKSVFYEKNEYLVTPLKTEVEAGQLYELYYEFKGMLNGSLYGFYKSSYIYRDSNGTEETRHLATSQFESTYARRAFPCFDEPSWKANFTVTLVHPKEMIALSNMPGEVSVREDELSETRFDESVKMSTYLVCVIVCDFKYKEKIISRDNREIRVRVYATPHQIEETVYALGVAVKTLEFYEEYFNITYPLPKLDMIGIPDFASGAMENWGLVTYKEVNLLYKEGVTPVYNQLRIGAVIGHELAHMWFGNLVTMKWWSDLWLNEGFASYIEYKSMDYVDPTWQIDSQFYAEDMVRVIFRDATYESHPIVQDVQHPNQISQLFDVISYSKGASVLRMLEFFMGDSFKRGISDYLDTYRFNNAETADLWEELQKAYKGLAKSDSDSIADIMDTWTLQMGYPCINVERKEKDVFSVSQTRFLMDSRSETEQLQASPFNYTWKVPLSYITADNPTSSLVWLNDKTKDFKIPGISETTWVKFNPGYKGYYIVDYKEEWDKIINIFQTNHTSLTPSDRGNLLSDAFLLARAEIMNYSKALTLSTYLTKEFDYMPYAIAINAVSYIANVLDISPEMKTYLDRLSERQVKALQWEDNGDHLTKRLRATAISLSCQSDNEDCLKNAGRELMNWLENKPISPNLKDTILCSGMKLMGNESIWDEMWARYLRESLAQERTMLLRGLACTEDKTVLKKYLDLAWNETNVRAQDYFVVMSNIATTPEGLQIVWDFYRRNWTDLVKRFGTHSTTLGSALKSISVHFKTEDRVKEMQEFFDKHKEAGAGEIARKEAIETVQGNIKWLKEHKDDVENWLEEQNKPFRHVRLPRYIIPKEYDVHLEPHLDNGTFNGSVEITVQLNKSSKIFLVHILNLNITESETSVIRCDDGTEMKISKQFPFPENEYWVLEMEHEAKEGEYKLQFCFEGTMTGLTGFYRSTYRNSKNETRHIATSQFQSTHARRAFPCFDEPSFKSHFTITLVHPEDYIALSNMPPMKNHKNKKIGNGLLETKFEKTVKPMVTYLVCAIVCDFTERSIIGGKNNIPIRVYASPDSYNSTEYALEAGKEVLETLEEYFQIDYPLPKLDMIAIPDFQAGAMENWGLITYREIYMLYDKNKTPPSTQFNIYMIIAHEIAHMWFGNLVTMEWWDDLWLNEGFATYMAYKVTTMNNKDWNGEGQFMLKEMNGAMKVDGTKQSNPIVRAVYTPAEISATFDSVTYGKGGSVLRMIETFVEEKNFQAGLQKYLNKYADKNAVTDDLWAELKDVSNELIDVKGIMNTWTRQMGYPVLSVAYNQSEKTATIEQKRFLLNPESTMKSSHVSPYGYTWKIPLQYQCLKNNNSNKWLMSAVKEERNLSHCDDMTQIKWNSNQKGYYLINYEESLWKEWAKDLSDDYKILPSSLDRSNILHDAFFLSQSGDLTYDLLLDLTKYLANEDDYIPWSTASGGLSEILRLLEDDTSSKMKEYIRGLTDIQWKKLEWNDSPDENLNKRLLRSTIVNLACAAANAECLSGAARLLNAFLDNDEELPVALRSQVYRYGLANSPNDTWDKLWERYMEGSSAQEKNDLLYGLAFTSSNETLEKFIKDAEKHVRQQDYFTAISYISANPKGLDIAWNYVRDTWEMLVERFTLKDRGLGGIVKTITSKFTTESKLEEVEDFFAQYPDAGAGAGPRKAALEIIAGNIRWKKRYEPIVKSWLDENVKVPS